MVHGIISIKSPVGALVRRPRIVRNGVTTTTSGRCHVAGLTVSPAFLVLDVQSSDITSVDVAGPRAALGEAVAPRVPKVQASVALDDAEDRIFGAHIEPSAEGFSSGIRPGKCFAAGSAAETAVGTARVFGPDIPPSARLSDLGLFDGISDRVSAACMQTGIVAWNWLDGNQGESTPALVESGSVV